MGSPHITSFIERLSTIWVLPDNFILTHKGLLLNFYLQFRL
nr:MAG TPA: hypothetical protein [Caudoviricetes sp.]